MVLSHTWETGSGAQRYGASFSVSRWHQSNDMPLIFISTAVYSASKQFLECCSALHTFCVMPFPRTKQQKLEERQADVEYELRCLLNKPGQCVTFFWLIYLKMVTVINLKSGPFLGVNMLYCYIIITITVGPTFVVSPQSKQLNNEHK